MIPSIAHTAEFQRISSLPRRAWTQADLASLTSSVTEILRTRSGGMRLHPQQALALHDAGTVGGLFGPLGVGEGKTLITMLLALAFEAERPLLLLPGGLVEKTNRERIKLSHDWQIPNRLRVMSLDWLSRVQAVDELENYRPDAIIVDEVHRLKNRRAAVTRRVARYMYAHPYTKFAGVSGTVMDRSILDFAHILRWALKLNAPIPITNEETEEWAEALDERIDPEARRKPGALLSLCSDEDWRNADGTRATELVAVRRAFRRRLTDTPGVVATIGEGEHVGASIYVRGIMHRVSAVTEKNFLKLRGDGTTEPGWVTPDDWELKFAVDVWRHAQELALGLHYVWEPRPPADWLDARRAWNKFVRETINRGRTYDSELHVANACDAGKLDATALTEWRRLRPTYEAEIVPMWHDDSALQVCKDWLKGGGIVWSEHRFFGERLAEYADVPYFGGGGFTTGGLYIEDAVPGSGVVASIDANREGKNLQGLWNRNLIVCPPSSAAWWEQTIARTHRIGQKADEVIVDVLLGCRENFDACMVAIAGARALTDTTGKVQKLLLADVTFPTEREIDAMKSPRWVR